jgi:hypothetical protein
MIRVGLICHIKCSCPKGNRCRSGQLAVQTPMRKTSVLNLANSLKEWPCDQRKRPDALRYSEHRGDIRR